MTHLELLESLTKEQLIAVIGFGLGEVAEPEAQ
jgi:hypothetical protein